ncbi:hypothetical protein HDE_13985 [Halotydeus destructor]|nr:hypothetical protein HDE_13985 [Halotydeus destructor]
MDTFSVKFLILQVMLLSCSSATKKFETKGFVRYGHREYITLEPEAFVYVNKTECIQACLGYGGELVEPRSREEEIFVERRCPFAMINVFYGMTETSRFDAWRYGSDGEPVEDIVWSERERCKNYKASHSVELRGDGWCSREDLRTYRCFCLKLPVQV